MKSPRILLLLALIQTGAFVLHAQTNIGANDPNIQYVGRFDMTIPTAPGFDWSYSTIRAKFQGTSCSVKLDGPSKYFDVFVDGAKTTSIISVSGGLETFPVAVGLSNTVHSISIHRRVEASQAGKNTFQGFILDSGKTLVAPGAGPSRRMAFIGDSWTCGYGAEAQFPAPYNNATENAGITYAAQMASNYNADCMITAWSGLGMVRNYNDPSQTSQFPFPYYYPRTCGSVAANNYAFEWQPDVVVIALGINDFSTTPYPSQAQYVGGYSNFVKTVRSHYPAADILCTYWSGMPAFASNYVAAVANTSGDSKVHFASVLFNFDFPADYGSDYHPNATGQTKIANAFIPVFDSIMGTNWGGGTNSSTPLVKFPGTVIGSPGSWSNLGNTITNVFDGNLATFYDAVNGTGDWAGLNLGSGTNGVVKQIRYCPRPSWAGRMVGGQFQGANVADFSSGVVTLATVAATPPEGVMTVQAVSNTNSFRYLRYLGPADGYGNVAEVEFLGLYAGVVPSAPTGMAAVAGNGSIALSWSASPNATSYYVKRSTTSGSGYVNIATNSSLTFTNTGLVNGTTYYYVVSAVNAGGESTNSTQASATPLAPPAAPAGIAAIAGEATVALSWNAAATATNYYLKRSTTSGSGYVNVATNASLTFTNTGLSNGTLYFFTVSALNASGEGANSVEVSARPTSFAPTALGMTVAGNQLQLNWPLDHTGWRLQAQTNALGTGLGTNWVNLSGSEVTNSFTLPVDTANGSVFFRLISP